MTRLLGVWLGSLALTLIAPIPYVGYQRTSLTGRVVDATSGAATPRSI